MTLGATCGGELEPGAPRVRSSDKPQTACPAVRASWKRGGEVSNEKELGMEGSTTNSVDAVTW
jgi:hypothetical protein